MKVRRLISGSLLLFVAVSLSFLVYKEIVPRGSRINSEKEAHIDAPRLPAKLPSTALRGGEENAAEGVAPFLHPVKQSGRSKIIAYYFHGTHRCPTCLEIERYSREAIEKYFPDELRHKKLEFRPLNMEEPEHRHYVQDYELYTNSLILVLYDRGKQVKWKNLGEIWTLAGDREEFYSYVKDEIGRLLQEIS